ncbi:MAG: RNA methyltransferase [Planctomycetes bacterium]|nr:RNA methyltransferase [Planctomycetota bacterium]
MPRIAVDSLDDPRVQMYRHLKSSNLLRDGRLFIAEGTKLVERLLASDYQTESVLIAERREEEWGSKIPADIPLYVIPQQVGEQLTGFNFHVGVLACGVRKPTRTIDEVLASNAVRQTVVICPNCDNPENLGAIIRIGSAFGIDALLLGRGCCDPFSRRVLRVSMGTAFRLPIVESPDLELDLIRLRDEWQLELIATVLDETAGSLAEAATSPRVGILFGNEADGLDVRWQSLCNRRLTIPMRLGTDSLNVSVAAGIFLHHFTK